MGAPISRAFATRFLLLASALAAGCHAPDEVPAGAEPSYVDVGAVDRALGVTCLAGEPCSGEGSVSSTTYRVGQSATSSGELLQTFVASASGAPRRVRLVLRNLRPLAGVTAPKVTVAVYGPVGAGEPDLSGLTPLLEGTLDLGALGAAGAREIALSGAGELEAGLRYALVVGTQADVLPAAASLLVGVGAITESSYADGSAFRRTRRRANASSGWGAVRFAPAGAPDAAFAFVGGAGSPCAVTGDCRRGVACAQGTCRAPSTTPVQISPSALTIEADGTQLFLATGGDPPYVYSMEGAGTLEGASYTAPGLAGTATVRVTDLFGRMSEAIVTVVPASRTTDCTGLPANAAWNTVSQITQSWTESGWSPSAEGIWSAAASTTECRFHCTGAFVWSGDACVVPVEQLGVVSPPAGSLDFGTVAVSASATLNVTLSNTGMQGSLLTVVASGHTAPFSVTSNGCSGVAAGASCVIAVRFAPAVGGVVTPQTLTLTPSAGAAAAFTLRGTGGADPLKSYVKILAPFDSYPAATFGNYSSGSTLYGPDGTTPMLSTTTRKWGAGSAAFNGTGAYLWGAANDFSISSSTSFTIEGWVYLAAASAVTPANWQGTAIFERRFDGGVVLFYMVRSPQAGAPPTILSLYWQNTNWTAVGQVTANYAFQLGTWYHLAVSRTGSGVPELFVNGVKQVNVSNTGTVPLLTGANNNLFLGGRPGNTNYEGYLNGFMDDFRVTVGAARYASDFPVPSAAFPTF